MSSPNTPRKMPVTIRLLLALSLAGLTAGCFQPLYGDRSVSGDGVRDKLNSVEVAPIVAPSGSRIARVGGVVRDNLMFDLTGASSAYRLNVSLTPTQLQVIVDINSGRPDILIFGADASYTLTELATGKPVVTAHTFSRVSYNVPGQLQRFAGDRGLRDAEDRAAKEIADSIRSRLASYFTAGT